SGDIEAFREFVESNREKVYYLARNLTGNHHDAEDLSQDVFIKVYQSISKFRKKAKIQTWLHRITVNAFIDRKRKRVLNIIKLNPEQEDTNRIPEPVEESVTGNPERYVDSQIMQKNIHQALDKLSPKERSVFVLKHYQNHTIREIASTLKIAEGTVKSLMFRSIQKMQKALYFYKKDLGLEEG
ncbi:MAG: RNA polymerase sigma factor, partial [Calditrichia bacterium]|nr:RNA polymerase sigma factor [Calditrichia bacterium]